PFLFKLKRPHNHIAGMGFFVAYSKLPISLAWEIFGEKNGAGSLDDLRSMLEPLTGSRSLQAEIGCTVLANVHYLPREQWIAEPSGWSGNIVRGKMYESEVSDGAILWTALQSRLSVPSVQEPGEKFGKPILVNPRLGQSSFRVLVTDAYKRRC